MIHGYTRLISILWLLGLSFSLACSSQKPAPGPPAELAAPEFRFTEAQGLGLEEGIVRRDPSDVIKAGDTYYVWYTWVDRSRSPEHLGASGYPGRIWYATSSDEGKTWTEQGQALGLGEPGAFDSHGVFTPGILAAGGRYYLFYTGVQPTPGRDDGVFENNSTSDFTAIGVAISDSPDGPWTRAEANPVLTVSEEPGLFDSYRVDDACLIVRDGDCWLYFKGRSLAGGREGPRHTKMGVAIAEAPQGPYVKYEGNPVLDSGHEVLVWPHREGVAALVSGTGPQGRTMQYAPDGIHFSKAGEFGDDYPRAAAAYRPGAFDDTGYGAGIRWGISMRHGPNPHLVRYETDMRAPAAENPLWNYKRAPRGAVGR